MLTLFLNPAVLSLAIDLILGRFATFNLEQKSFYLLTLAGSTAWWMFLAWIVRAPLTRRNQILSTGIALLYAVTFVLVYGYRATTGTMPNYYTFEYIFAEPFNSWTLLRDTWSWVYTLAIPVVALIFWLGFTRWRAYLAARCQKRRHAVVAGVALSLAVIIQLVIHNNIRFVDQCFTADMTVSTSIMRNFYTRFTDPNAGRSGLAARMPIAVPEIRPAEGSRSPNLLVILTESLRADALGIYGSSRPTTPFLDSLCRNYPGTVARFDNAFASATMTFIAVPTFVTGVSPLASALTLHTQPTFWEYCKAAGYETFFFTSQSQEWENIKTFFTIPAIDHHFNKETVGIGEKNDLGIDDHYVVDHFISWLQSRKESTPFTGILQLNQTHYPFWTPDSLRLFGETDRRDLYDNAVRYTDGQLRRVITAIAMHGELDNTVIVLTSDHGEAFNEHGIFGHLNCLYREGIRVPMILFVPPMDETDGPRSKELEILIRNTAAGVSNLDVLPTLLDFAGIWNDSLIAAIRTGIAGYSLLEPLPTDRIVVTSNLTEMTRNHLGLSLVTGNWHYILNLQGEKTGVEELYDWEHDPAEANNVITSIPPDLRLRLDQYLASYPVSQRIRKSLPPG